jgi:hypothetical protein
MSEIQMEPEKTRIEKPQEPEDLGKLFKDYFTKIILFDFGLKKFYFRKKMKGRKLLIDIQLEVVLHSFNRFMQKYLIFHNDEKSNDSSMDSPLIDPKELPKQTSGSPKEEDFIGNLLKFEGIIEMLINIGPFEMFREVKCMILTEFETTATAIQKYLEKKNEKDLLVFTNITQTILFSVSFMVVKLDYYTITINCLVEKLNRFFIDFVTRAKDSKAQSFVSCLNLVQKFIKIKKTYMTEFCLSSTTKKESLFNFSFNKFCSFGRYFFNNLYLMMDNDVGPIPRLGKQKVNTKFDKDFTPRKKLKKVFSKTTILPRSAKSQTNVTNFTDKNLNNTENRIFDFSLQNITRKTIKSEAIVRRRSRYGKLYPEMYKLFKIYFISKLANWKYVSINISGQKKEEICRICEKTFKIDNFILHVFYCKEQKMYIQNYNELRGELNKSIEKLVKYKE